MWNLKHWQDKIKEKRKNTPFRDFIKEIWSWIPIVLHKGKWEVSRYPETDRIKTIPTKEYEKNIEELLKYWLNYDFSIKLIVFLVGKLYIKKGEEKIIFITKFFYIKILESSN